MVTLPVIVCANIKVNKKPVVTLSVIVCASIKVNKKPVIVSHVWCWPIYVLQTIIIPFL
jgi:hypothetical protein